MTMKKILTLAVMLTCLAGLMGSCKKKSLFQSTLEKEVSKLNQQCPMNMGILGEISSVELDDSVVVFNIQLTSQLVKLDKLKTHSDDVKEGMLLQFAENPNSLESFIQSKCRLRYVYQNDKTGDKMAIEVTPDDIKRMSGLINKPDEVAQRKVEILVSNTRLQLPMNVDAVTLLDDMVIEGDTVCYVYSIDSEQVSADQITSDIEGMKQNIIKNLDSPDPALQYLVTCLSDADKSLCYRYVFQPDGQRVEILLSADEVKRIANN